VKRPGRAAWLVPVISNQKRNLQLRDSAGLHLHRRQCRWHRLRLRQSAEASPIRGWRHQGRILVI